MRPNELDVTLHLDQVLVNKTEDSGGDDPYLWVLGFKVDADTIGPPAVGTLVPTIGVRTVVGPPSLPWLVGPGSVNAGPTPLTIPATLGTRSLRLRPALIEGAGWFDGLAGIVALVWDQDAFAPSTSEAGHAAFNAAFGPALAHELQTLLQGDPGYDAALNTDAAGNPLPDPPEGFGLPFRIRRMADPAGLSNAVRELTRRVKGAIRGPIRSALTDAAGWDEIIDPDDLLGADAAVFTGRQLSASQQSIVLRYTDDEADYEIRGGARATRVRQHRLASSVISLTSTYADSASVTTRVCWFPERTYVATATRLTSTTRLQVLNIGNAAPVEVRWFLDETPLPAPTGAVPVQLSGVAAITGGPGKPLADAFPGGPGTLAYSCSGTTLDLSNAAGDGVWSGTVRAILAYAGDPPLIPPFPASSQDIWDRGYELVEDLSIVTVEVRMDSQYVADVKRCLGTVKDIDLKRIPVVLGPRIDLGDPHPNWSVLQEVAREQDLFASLVERTREEVRGGIASRLSAEQLRTLDTLRVEGLLTGEEVATIRARAAVR
ncbi:MULTISPECIES: hypothetical protein [unclassified Actinotalea]|uniref:hypothetical protein n=1 Tax=unclassified Actinotalea TaxID=2638618 RepID=UPI0015F64DCF|nr:MULTISPECIES: hypothetical protein [unclassified Actinotalea]